MKQFILMNKNTGEIGCGIRFNCFDHPEDRELMNLEGYKINLTSVDPDAWAIQCSDTEPWLMFGKEMIVDKLEIVCEL